jgi:Spy/CpxP family protein refolding chaperone
MRAGATRDFILIGTLIAWVASTAAWAQPPGDPLMQAMFPPELVMRHQQELNLTDAQRNAITAEMDRGQKDFLDVRWRLEKEMEAMTTLLKEDKLDEKRVLAQLNKVLDMERQIKRAHLVLLIRIRGVLTPEQRAKLAEIKQRLPRFPGPGGGPMGGGPMGGGPMGGGPMGQPGGPPGAPPSGR